MRQSEYILFEESPAVGFNEAYPIGNGSLGGVYGGFPKMRLGLNHDTLWTGDRPVSYEDFNREAFLRGQARGGESILVCGGCPMESIRQKNNRFLPKELEGKRGVAFAAAMRAGQPSGGSGFRGREGCFF